MHPPEEKVGAFFVDCCHKKNWKYDYYNKEQVRFVVLLQSCMLLHVFTASDIIDTDLYCQEEGFL